MFKLFKVLFSSLLFTNANEEYVCFIKVDLDKYDLGWIQKWIMSLSEKMPNVQWCIWPHGIDLGFFCKEDALKYLDWVKEKINEA